MTRLLEEALVERTGLGALALIDLEVDVILPQHFRHVQSGLRNSELINCAASVCLAHALLEIRILAPRPAVVRHGLEVVGVERPAPVHLAECQFQRDVLCEDFLLPAHSDGPSEQLPRRGQVSPPHMELGSVDPYLREAETGVRYQVEACVVHLRRAVEVFSLHLLVQRVVYPEIYVSLPVLLLGLVGRDVGDGSLIHLPDLVPSPIAIAR
mmetsp:Transcript_29143/g.65320  ORF Transcript_29143/g.65320 Transcript_29143/m.65320 type:complete len:211 (+) Transcript_29143:593-1225(+)